MRALAPRIVAIALALGAPAGCAPRTKVAPPSPSPSTPSPPPRDAHAGGDFYKPRPDTHEADPSVARGSVVVELRDADDRPMPSESVALVQISETPEPDVLGRTDGDGRATLSAPSWGGDVRIVAKRGGSCFLSPAFPMPKGGGTRVILHAYDVTSDLGATLVAFQSMVIAEAMGDDLRVTVLLDTYNLGKIAWAPSGVSFRLPEGASGFESGVTTDTSVELTASGGRATLAGTIPPGEHRLYMQWRVPRRAKGNALRVEMPPRVARVRVMAAAGPSTVLGVADFPEARRETVGERGPYLVTERDLTRAEPLKAVVLEVKDAAAAKP